MASIPSTCRTPQSYHPSVHVSSPTSENYVEMVRTFDKADDLETGGIGGLCVRHRPKLHSILRIDIHTHSELYGGFVPKVRKSQFFDDHFHSESIIGLLSWMSIIRTQRKVQFSRWKDGFLFVSINLQGTWYETCIFTTRSGTSHNGYGSVQSQVIFLFSLQVSS